MQPGLSDEVLGACARYFLEKNLDADMPYDEAKARATQSILWLLKLAKKHRKRLNPMTDLRVLSHLVGCAQRLTGETIETLSARGRSLLAARGGHARWRSMTPEQRVALQAMAVSARKRKARERKEVAKGSGATEASPSV